METGRPNHNTSIYKFLPFPKTTSHEACSMCIGLASGEPLWTVAEDHGGQLFQPVDVVQHCPRCGARVQAYGE